MSNKLHSYLGIAHIFHERSSLTVARTCFRGWRASLMGGNSRLTTRSLPRETLPFDAINLGFIVQQKRLFFFFFCTSGDTIVHRVSAINVQISTYPLTGRECALIECVSRKPPVLVRWAEGPLWYANRGLIRLSTGNSESCQTNKSLISKLRYNMVFIYKSEGR